MKGMRRLASIAVGLLLCTGLAWLLLRRSEGPEIDTAASRSAGTPETTAEPLAAPLPELRGLGRTGPTTAPEPTAPAPTEASLLVRIGVSDGKKSPSAAWVEVTESTGRRVRAEGDAEGKAVFDALHVGHVTLEAGAPGYAHEMDASADLVPGPNETSVLLSRGVSVQGRVVSDEDGRPIADARVDVQGGGSFGNTTSSGGRASYGVVRTDADGQFHTLGLPFDFIVTLVVEARGHCRLSVPMLLHPVDGERAPLELRMAPGGTVRGIVRDPSGNAAPGARVAIGPEGMGARWIQGEERIPLGALWVACDAEGSFLADGIALDKVHCAIATAPGHASSASVCGLRATRDRSVVEVELRLRRFATLVVFLRDASDRPAAEGHASLGHDTEPVDADGRIQFGNLPPGDYSLEVGAPDHRTVREVVALAEGETIERRFPLVRGLELVGVVVDEKGEPLPGIEIQVERTTPDEEDGGGTNADSRGRFRVGGLAAGEFTVRVLSEGNMSGSVEKVHVPGPDVRVVVRRGASVRARFVPPAGSEPPTSMEVADYATSGSGGGGGRSWEEGRVTWAFPAGERRLVVRVPGFVPWSRLVDAPPGEALDLGDVPLDVGLTLTGKVVDAQGKPVAAAAVSSVDAAGTGVQSDAEGRFRLEHVSPQSISVEVVASGFITSEVRVDPRRGSGPVVVRLWRGARLDVRVVDSERAPVKGVHIHVHDPSSAEPDARGTWAWAESDEKGKGAVRIQPGRYRVDVLKDDGTVVGSKEVTLEEAKDATVDVEVSRP